MLTDGGTHSSTASALTTVRLVEIAKADFQYLMSRRPLLRERIMRRAQREEGSWQAIGANSVFANFSLSQVRLRSVGLIPCLLSAAIQFKTPPVFGPAVVALFTTFLIPAGIAVPLMASLFVSAMRVRFAQHFFPL